MKQLVTTAVSPQSKIAFTNDRFGNPGLKRQQGSTIEIYDIIQLDPTQTQYEFFINSKNKAFPFTNLVDSKLQPQESFALERSYFTFITQDTLTGAFTEVRPLDLSTDAGLFMGEVEIQIENQRVIKPIPLRSYQPEFNPDADNALVTVLEYDTQIVIPPLLTFKATVKFPAGSIPTPAENTVDYLAFTMGGPGGIFAPKSNY